MLLAQGPSAASGVGRLAARPSSTGQAPPSSKCMPAAASNRRRSVAVSAQAEAEADQETAMTFNSYNRNAYLRSPGAAFEYDNEILAELSDVTLRLEKRHGGQPWLPNKAKPSCLPLVKFIEDGVDIFTLSFEKLYAEAAPHLTPADEAHLRKLSVRYYVERVLSREQLIERCRRIYESDPQLFYSTDKEAQDLIEAFTQLDMDSFQLTVLVGKRAEERESEIALHVSRHPGQNLPDPTDLAIADVTLYLEFERELFLLERLDDIKARSRKKQEEVARRKAAFDSVLLLLDGAAEMGLTTEEMLEVGASEEHVEEYLATRGSLPFTLEEFVESKQAWLKAKREREAAERQELQNRLRAASEEPLDVDVIGGPPLVDSMDRRRAPMPSPKRGPEYESNLAEALGSRPVETGFATPSAGGMRKAPTGGAPRSGPALRGAAKQRANASGGEGAAGGRGKRDDDDDSVWGAE